METDKISTVSLRIFSKELNSKQITDITNLTPTKSSEIGESIGGRTNPEKKREETLWVYKMDVSENMAFEEQINTLVNKIEENQTAFEKLKKNCLMDIFCSYTTKNGQGGIGLDKQLIKRLSVLNVDLILDFYAI